ncbi:MAG: hypothetical protein ACO294_07580 [Methylococcales bacterium]
MQSISQQLQDDIRKIMDATIEEKKLVGGQAKLDKNHNGKLDSQDFKIIRGEKKTGMYKEDAEQQDEATLSAKAGRAGKDLGAPGKNFSKIASSAAKKYGSEEAGKKVAGAILAKMRKEETEQQDEASNWRDLGKEWSKSTPKPNGGSGKKQGSAYGGSKQKDEKPVKEERSFNDYLVAAIGIVGENHAVELANYAFNLQDTSIFEEINVEAFNPSSVNAQHAADVKAHHTNELKKKADAGDEKAKKRLELIQKSQKSKRDEFNSRMNYM